MSRSYPDEFVILPSSDENSTVKLDIRRTGSRDPLGLDGSGRQHRPAEPVRDALRYVEVEDEFVAPGPGHEREFSMASVPTVAGGSPGALVNEPGKLVGFGTRVVPECSAPVAAMLNVTSALEKAHGHGQVDGCELAPMTRPQPVVGHLSHIIG